MRRRTAIIGGGTAVIGGFALAVEALKSPASTGGSPVQEDRLALRDPRSSPAARSVYRMLVALENAARDGRPRRTVIGQHVELHNELYNPDYGDRHGTKPPGYYYRKARDISGRLPGFLEVDLGPGYEQPGWAVGRPRSYSLATWPSGRTAWSYTDDAVDLATGVWFGLPRASVGTYSPDGRDGRHHGSGSVLPDNGGGPAGLVGMSFHQPWPGSPVKGYRETLHENSPAVTDPGWIERVLTPGTTEHQALILDWSFLADHLGYLAEHDVPVLLRPYHEMNPAGGRPGFWWSGLPPERYQALWRTLYAYLVGSRGLHNLIFVWSPAVWDGVHGSEPGAYYPGTEYVDVVGVDDYSGGPDRPFGGGPWTKKWYDGLAAYGKPRVMAESFHVPLNAYQRRTLDVTPWVLWTVWGQALTQHNVSGPQGMNTPQDVRTTYGSPQILTGGHGPTGPDGWSWASLHP
ncbi:glycoside hydrolase family 26 protein [Streptomyces sp. NPDC001118]